MRKPRKPLSPRTSPIRRSAVKRSQKRIPQINIARAKRKQEKRTDFYRSPEWRALRKAALKRAGHRCEYVIGDVDDVFVNVCRSREHLEVHHLRYTKIRPTTALSDLQVLCRAHHRQAEAERPYRQARRRAIERASA